MSVVAPSELRISETFFSIQGESSWVGFPTFFIRLTGCPLRCVYCDTAYAFTGGQLMTWNALIDRVKRSHASRVCITGGEPLAQPQVHGLMERLCDLDYDVSLETSGALNVSAVDSRVKKIMDLKTPGSQEVSRNDYANLDSLTAQDELKIVVCNRLDYDWVKQKFNEFNLAERVFKVLLSPSHQGLAPNQLAQWILEDKLPVRLQLQMHKYIWGDVPGH